MDGKDGQRLRNGSVGLWRGGQPGAHAHGEQDHACRRGKHGLPANAAALALSAPPDQVHDLVLARFRGRPRYRVDAGQQVLHPRQLGQFRGAGRAPGQVLLERLPVRRFEQAKRVGADVGVHAAHGLAVHAVTPLSAMTTRSALSA